MFIESSIMIQLGEKYKSSEKQNILIIDQMKGHNLEKNRQTWFLSIVLLNIFHKKRHSCTIGIAYRID